jgi:hypothetical protein
MDVAGKAEKYCKQNGNSNQESPENPGFLLFIPL